MLIGLNYFLDYLAILLWRTILSVYGAYRGANTGATGVNSGYLQGDHQINISRSGDLIIVIKFD